MRLVTKRFVQRKVLDPQTGLMMCRACRLK